MLLLSPSLVLLLALGLCKGQEVAPEISDQPVTLPVAAVENGPSVGTEPQPADIVPVEPGVDDSSVVEGEPIGDGEIVGDDAGGEIDGGDEVVGEGDGEGVGGGDGEGVGGGDGEGVGGGDGEASGEESSNDNLNWLRKIYLRLIMKMLRPRPCSDPNEPNSGMAAPEGEGQDEGTRPAWEMPTGRPWGRPMGRPWGRPMGRPWGRPMWRPSGRPMWDLTKYGNGGESTSEETVTAEP